MEAFAYIVGLKVTGAFWRSERRGPVVPEPEFKPFVFSKEEPVAPVTASAPATLQQLGVPAGLAGELEAALRHVGAVQGDRVVGFTFRTPDGVSHALRQDIQSERATRRAA
jgi:hypothetical protein